MDPVTLAVFAPVIVPYAIKKFSKYKMAKTENEFREPTALPATDNRSKIHANFLATQRLEKSIYGADDIKTTECPCDDCHEYREGQAEREAKAARLAEAIERERQLEVKREAMRIEANKRKAAQEAEKKRLIEIEKAKERERFRQAKMQYHRHHLGEEADKVIVESDDGVVVAFDPNRWHA